MTDNKLTREEASKAGLAAISMTVLANSFEQCMRMVPEIRAIGLVSEAEQLEAALNTVGIVGKRCFACYVDTMGGK